jgi:hypothetical protein
MIAFGCSRSKVSMASAFMRAFSARCRGSDAAPAISTGPSRDYRARHRRIGAALSTSLAGLVVVYAAFSAAFLVLAGIAASGFLLYFFGMPETRDLDEPAPCTIYEKATTGTP